MICGQGHRFSSGFFWQVEPEAVLVAVHRVVAGDAISPEVVGVIAKATQYPLDHWPKRAHAGTLDAAQAWRESAQGAIVRNLIRGPGLQNLAQMSAYGAASNGPVAQHGRLHSAPHIIVDEDIEQQLLVGCRAHSALGGGIRDG